MTAPVTNRKILAVGGIMYIMVTKDFFADYTFQDHCDALNVLVVRVQGDSEKFAIFRILRVNFVREKQMLLLCPLQIVN